MPESSLIMATPPLPVSLLCVNVLERERGGVVLLAERIEGVYEENGDIFPGTPAVEGIKFDRLRSVGGLNPPCSWWNSRKLKWRPKHLESSLEPTLGLFATRGSPE